MAWPAGPGAFRFWVVLGTQLADAAEKKRDNE